MTAPDEIFVTSWHIPASIIAKWPPPNLVNPELRHGLIPLCAVLLVISTSFVAARIYARVTARAGQFGLDDVLIIAAWVTGVGSVAGTIWDVVGAGLDRHIWDAMLIGEKGGIAAWIQEFIFLISSCLTKISVLVFFHRIFFTHEPKKQRWLIEVPILFLVCYMFAVLLTLILNCNPTNAYWKSMDPNYTGKYTCIDRHIYDPLKGILSVVSDVYALLLPQFLIWKLGLTTESRWRLAITFCCGWIATGAGIARSYYLTRLFADPLRDLTWVGYDIQTWAQLENQLAIVCASVPAAVSFAKRCSKKEQNSVESWQTPSSEGSQTLANNKGPEIDIEKV